ncbi:MAG: PIG-L family deacetylase [Acidimicrobiaceae bacterium]|nr:PIG-L family deacetylase [Acidimicrobiaceae bacterium]
MHNTTTIDLPTPARALAIGAHPDDIEFGCGATLHKWGTAGCVVSFLICTDGSKGTWDAQADVASLIVRRQNEQIEAAKRLAAIGEVRFLGETDGELGVDRNLQSKVAEIIRELRPQVLLGHDPWKRWRLHPDHRAAGFLCTDSVVAARDPHFFPEHGTAYHRPDELLLFECEEPDHLELVSKVNVNAKVNALLAHESQFESTHGISSVDSTEEKASFAENIFKHCRRSIPKAGPMTHTSPKTDNTTTSSAPHADEVHAEAFKRMTGL